MGRAAGGAPPPAGPRRRLRPARPSSRVRGRRARSSRSICPVASTAAVRRERRLADGGRELPQDPLDLLTLRARRLRLAVGELDDVERLDEERLAGVGRIVNDPGHASAGARLDGQHGAAAAESDELLLQVLAELARADELLELVAHALPPGPELAAQLAELRRGVVAQVGAVLLDRSVDRLGHARERRVDCRRELAEERCRRLVESGAGAQRAGRGVGDAPQRLRRERAAEGGMRRLVPDVADLVERRLERLVQERDRLGRQRLPTRDLVRVGRGLELGCERGAEARSPLRARPAPGSRETPARRGRSGPSDRV